MDHGSCAPCPEGATCDGKSSNENLKLRPGFWRISNATAEVYGCPFGTASCRGGGNFTDSGDGYCKRGYTGPLCAVCVPELYVAGRAEKHEHTSILDVFCVRQHLRCG